jgi:hypothetical protein
MNPLDLENSVKELVVAEFGVDVPVTAFPDKLETHKMLGNAEILLGYRGGPFETPRLGSAEQMRTVAFELLVLSRSMSGHHGAVAILDRLRLALQGQVIPGIVFPIRIVKDSYLGRISGQWQYSLEIAVAGVPALAKKPQVNEPAITRLTAKSDSEVLIVHGESLIIAIFAFIACTTVGSVHPQAMCGRDLQVNPGIAVQLQSVELLYSGP